MDCVVIGLCVGVQEWLSGLALLQHEEAERISKFVYRKDAKLALVSRDTLSV